MIHLSSLPTTRYSVPKVPSASPRPIAGPMHHSYTPSYLNISNHHFPVILCYIILSSYDSYLAFAYYLVNQTKDSSTCNVTIYWKTVCSSFCSSMVLCKNLRFSYNRLSAPGDRQGKSAAAAVFLTSVSLDYH